MRSYLIAIAAVLVCLLVLKGYFSHTGQPGRDNATAAPATTPSPPQSAPGGQPPAKQVDAPLTSAAHNYRQEFQAQEDYWRYAQQLLPQARAGDADAQFYLAKIL